MTDEITVELVQRLIRDQLPQWADLPVRPVPKQGWDNRTFRLGTELSVRLPGAPGYVPGLRKEDLVLERLQGRLPVPIPRIAAGGRPSQIFDHQWSVRHWLPGTALDDAPAVDAAGVASSLGEVLRILRTVAVTSAPWAGAHSCYRGCHPSVYNDDVQRCLSARTPAADPGACLQIWREAVASAWPHRPVWIHGDVAPGNVLVNEQGRLEALIDFGQSAVGDPACDLVIAWTYFDRASRRRFQDAVDLDEHTWRRARGWALWKALITLEGADSPARGVQERALAELLSDPLD